MPPTLYLIDGHALAYRTYYAIAASNAARLSTSSGELTAGVYGFASVLLRLLENDRPEYLAVAFDTGKTFRDTLFPEYKATREKMPDDLSLQMNRIRQLVDTFKIPRLEMEGFEADDVLGSVAHAALLQGFGVKIITGDRDLLQLVEDRIIVNLPGKQLADSKDYTHPDVVAYLGVRPDQVIDYKALAGDTSDNIPGVRGIGEKTAVSLLQEYDHLDDIYAHLGQLPARVRTRLEDGRESAQLSYKLAAIRTDVPITLDLESANTSRLDLPAVEALFQELEFRTLLKRLANLQRRPVAPSSGQQLSLFGEPVKRVGIPAPYQLDVQTVTTLPGLQQLADRLAKAAVIAIDTETTSTDPLQADLVGISLSVEEGQGYYIPIGHRNGEQLSLEQVMAALRLALEDPQKQIIGHNLKFDLLVLNQHGLHPVSCTFDTMIAEWLVDPASHNLGLKDMADRYLALNMTHIEELIGKGKSQISMAQVAIGDAAPYAAADADATLRLMPVLQKRMDELNAASLFQDVEMPLMPVLAEMERNGISLDQAFFKQMSGELSQRMQQITTRIYQDVGYSFNLNSTQQLSQVLFEKLGLKPPDQRKRTSSGHFSTAASILEEIQHQHPVVDAILEYRELAKIKSTYIDALPLQINPHTGRVHTSFNQTGSVTGRLTSSNPNLQNIPTRTDLGRQVRKGFVAAPGMTLVSVDYSQIELRVVAHMSQDQAMLEAFRAGQDIHAATAAAIFNQPIDQVTKDQRRHAKAINFGLIYGMSAFGLTRTTDLTLAEAENFVKAYFKMFPRVKQYLDDIRQQAARQGYVETLLGRRRYFPNLKAHSNVNLKNREEREAINAPIQGTAADIMKIAMIRILPAIQQAGLNAHLLLQVHDELVLECSQDQVAETAQLVQKIMSEAYPLSIPLLTDASSGNNWGDL